MTARPVRFRAATEADTDDIRSCITDAYAVYSSTVPDLPNVTEGLSEEVAQYPTWIALAQDRVAGCVILHDDETPPVLANLAVRPDTGGRGIGSALIALAESHCRAQGFARMALTTHVALPRLKTYYEGHGFAVTEISPPRMRMEKAL